jgi:hypothetical protein
MSIEKKMDMYLLGSKTINESGGMVQLKQLGPNFTMVTIGATRMYFSYETLVAFLQGGHLYATSEKYSKTTSKQMNQHLPTVTDYLDSSEFENLARKKLGGADL